MNKEHYNKAMQNKISRSVGRQEKRFYKKRIVDLTKDLLSKPSFHEEKILTDVKYAFDNYIKTCVHYFKSLDNNDILQEEYDNISLTNPNTNTSQTSHQTQEELDKLDKLLMRNIKIENPLDKFVKKTFIKKPEEPIIPKQKDIDLTNPTLKKKGIQKKEKKATNEKKENIV